MRAQQRSRKGVTVVIICFMILPLMGLLAFSIDYGFLLFMRTDLQRAADNACTAAVRELLPDATGYQDLERVRATARQYLQSNLGTDFVIPDSDIEIGRYDPATIYDSVDLLSTGVFDTVRLTVRRSDVANGSITLYFASVFGFDTADVSVISTAVLQKGQFLEPGAEILPIALPVTTWNTLGDGAYVNIYGDGRLTDDLGNQVPGNWGTLDIGARSNSTNALVDQIVNGLDQQDLDVLHRESRIPIETHIDSQAITYLNGDTGFSGGIKKGIDAQIGSTKLIPLFESYVGQGGGLEFKIVGWASVNLVAADWAGGQNSSVTVQKNYKFQREIRPNPDLSDVGNTIEAVFTSPVLVE